MIMSSERPSPDLVLSPKFPSSRPKPRAFVRRSGETPVFPQLRHKLTPPTQHPNHPANRLPRILSVAALSFISLVTTTAFAQSLDPPPLPANYTTILDNPDMLVMRVHYGPHEVVPIHDHSAYPTVFVYLNDAGPIRIDHAPPNASSVVRPPTHTGAFRIAPGLAERHSITNLSDTPSDSLRVELKSIPPSALADIVRGPAPSTPEPGIHTDFENPALRIERIVCSPTEPCETAHIATNTRALLVALTPLVVRSPERKHDLKAGDVLWLPPTHNIPFLNPGAQALRITLLNPPAIAPTLVMDPPPPSIKQPL